MKQVGNQRRALMARTKGGKSIEIRTARQAINDLVAQGAYTGEAMGAAVRNLAQVVTQHGGSRDGSASWNR